jgi:hypothetical protein
MDHTCEHKINRLKAFNETVDEQHSNHGLGRNHQIRWGRNGFSDGFCLAYSIINATAAFEGS